MTQTPTAEPLTAARVDELVDALRKANDKETKKSRDK